jgi:hypothetical protein
MREILAEAEAHVLHRIAKSLKTWTTLLNARTSASALW